MNEDAAGNPPVYCDHKPPKVATIRAGDKVRVQCLTCGTVGPARDSPGEAFRALLKVPYRANEGDMRITCVTANRRMKGARGVRCPRRTAVSTATVGAPNRQGGARSRSALLRTQRSGAGVRRKRLAGARANLPRGAPPCAF
jgi:hypothetical protein